MSSENPKTAVQTQCESIVFFDGVCGLCNSTIDFLVSRDRNAALKFAPLQGTTAEQLVPEDVRRQLSTFVFADGGQLFYRSAAFVRILRRLGGIWGAIGTVLWLIPWPLRDLGYRVVSRLRYLLFGKRETCRMPTAEERERFLD